MLFLFSSKKTGAFGGMFGMLKGLVGSKNLTREDMESVLEKMKDHLIGRTQTSPRQCRECFKSSLFSYLSCSSLAKNVAADISAQLCDSVAKKLEGKVMGTFTSEWSFSAGHHFSPQASPGALTDHVIVCLQLWPPR